MLKVDHQTRDRKHYPTTIAGLARGSDSYRELLPPDGVSQGEWDRAVGKAALELKEKYGGAYNGKEGTQPTKFNIWSGFTGEGGNCQTFRLELIERAEESVGAKSSLGPLMGADLEYGPIRPR